MKQRAIWGVILGVWALWGAVPSARGQECARFMYIDVGECVQRGYDEGAYCEFKASGVRSLFVCDPLTCTINNITSVTSDDCLAKPDPVTGSCTASPRVRSGCNRTVSADCAGSAPACNGGGCGAGQYCRAKVSNANECTCAVSSSGCYGGYVFECRNSCTGGWNPGGGLSCDPGQVSCRRCCSMTAPGAPSLIAPANGAQRVRGAVSLRWNATADWGGFCPNMARSEAVKQELDSGPQSWAML